MGVVAEFEKGAVEGRERSGALLFAGIPYAEPPLGERRFRPPEPHAGWSEVRDARRFGRAAPQRPGGGLTDRPMPWDEDCLTLNVTTPALDAAARPVLVWIHGGGFRTGKGGIPWYDGASFAAQGDVVTVTINYRLGALGFACIEELGGADYAQSGLTGVLDQICALEWVRDHIAAFGGDPERVTIAGESAGGMSVGTLLGSPRAAGLFRGAIAQSGAAHHTLPRALGREVGRAFLDAAGVDTIEALLALAPDAILDAQDGAQQTMAERYGADATGVGGMAFQPVVGCEALPEAPIDAIRAGASRDVAVLTGTNRDETTLFEMGRGARQKRLERLAERSFSDPDAALASYRATRPDADAGALLVALTTDHMFRIPAIRLSEAHAAQGGASWHYGFDWASRAFDGKLGATHALEIPFAFNTLAAPGVDVFLGPGEPPQDLADRMHAAWIAFVREGDPSCDHVPEWPRYASERRAVMHFGDAVEVRDDPGRNERVLWDGKR